jgi:hypothetical protein
VVALGASSVAPVDRPQWPDVFYADEIGARSDTTVLYTRRAPTGAHRRRSDSGARMDIDHRYEDETRH